MNILLVHEHYQHPGGEDAVFNAEAELLESNGHIVTRLEFDNSLIPESTSTASKLGLAGNTIWSRENAQVVRTAAIENAVQIAHFHNTFPLVSPAAYVACRRIGVPVIQTLHNYRLICPAYNLLRDGRQCEDCVGKAFAYPGVAHGCYRHSRTETLVTAVMLSAHRVRGTWSRDVNRYIALTQFARSKFVEGGLPDHLIVVKPNFVHEPPPPRDRVRDRFLFVGRLATEKGIDCLLDAIRHLSDNITIRIAGQGELANSVATRARTDRRIDHVGPLPHYDAIRDMGEATALIFPSIWYEGFPMTIVEAFSCGTPVITSRLGSMAEIVEDGKTGLHFQPGDAADLASTIQWASGHPDEMRQMGENARREYEQRYTPNQNYAMLMDVYREALSDDIRPVARQARTRAAMVNQQLGMRL